MDAGKISYAWRERRSICDKRRHVNKALGERGLNTAQ
jgi:hypothetical protein